MGGAGAGRPCCTVAAKLKLTLRVETQKSLPSLNIAANAGIRMIEQRCEFRHGHRLGGTAFDEP